MRWLALAVFAGCIIEPRRPPDPDAPIAPPEPNYAFVTSTTVIPSLLFGFEGADLVCNQAAAAGHVPGTYVAWLSTSDTNAVDRIAGSEGWQRPDHMPVADLATDVATGHLLFPIRLDELGHDVGETTVATGTDPSGHLVPNLACADWRGSGQYEMGAPDAELAVWTYSNTLNCGAMSRLYCFGIGTQVAVSPPRDVHPLGFVTSQPYALLSGLADADSTCSTVARAAGLSGNYRALLATSTASARSRFTRTGPWYRRDGVAFTQDLKTFDAPLDVTETGSHVAVGVLFGAPSPDVVSPMTSCGDWINATGSTSTGNSARSIAAAFTGDSGAYPCGNPAHLYCLEL
jgi:hypothetical protein